MKLVSAWGFNLRYAEKYTYREDGRIIRIRDGRLADESITQAGYRRVFWLKDGRKTYCAAHRVVWELCKGPIPIGLQVDHINGVKTDNRIENLRLVTQAENQQNVPRKGYYWYPKNRCWGSCISIDGKRLFLGLFQTEAEAKAAYLAAKKVHHKAASEYAFQ